MDTTLAVPGDGRRYPAWSSSLPKTQTLSLSYLFLLVGFVGLCLAVYPSCRVYSIIGAILIFMFAIAFVRRIRTLAAAGAFAFALIWIATIVDVLFHGPATPVSYTHLRAHETREDLVCRLLLEKLGASRSDSPDLDDLDRRHEFLAIDQVQLAKRIIAVQWDFWVAHSGDPIYAR